MTDIGSLGAKHDIVRRPRRSSARIREKIMKTATAEFARHGFAGARIARIVKRAESNPRMIYHYFGNKSQLYIAVLENALAGLRTVELDLDVELVEDRPPDALAGESAQDSGGCVSDGAHG